jgi:hypothetical protein
MAVMIPACSDREVRKTAVAIVTTCVTRFLWTIFHHIGGGGSTWIARCDISQNHQRNAHVPSRVMVVRIMVISVRIPHLSTMLRLDGDNMDDESDQLAVQSIARSLEFTIDHGCV